MLSAGAQNVLSGETYGVLVPYEGLVIRKLFLEAEKGQLVLRSENQSHQDQYFSYEEFAESIIGRVVWVMQEV
jgi:phage repressor protein C with HTH and peptisase S24 domain